MNLKKLFTISFVAYILVLFTLLILNGEYQFIEESLWINIVVVNLVFMVAFFIMALVITHNLQKKIKQQDKLVSDLKGKLYDSIKDDEEREKMIKAFEKSLK